MAAIVGIVASLIGPSIELGKGIAAPIKKQFNYLFCFNSNIQSLNDEAEKLEEVRVGVQMKVDTANRNAQVILPEVETWVKSVKNDQAKINGINSKIPNVRSGVLNLKARYSLSRQAKKMADVIKGRIDESRGFEQISNPAPPASMGSIPSSTTQGFESRKHVEERIMAALRDENVNMIGLCGMGGVGKTTMAKRLMNRVREENMFDEVVMAVVSQQADYLKIQQQLADNLGLSLGVETLLARAHLLRKRLTGTKRVLIVLDDVWDYLKLEELGIPYEGGFERCKILLTSRNQGVLTGMGAHKVIAIQVLPEEEAWFLFRERAGDCVNHQDLQSIAKAVVKECKGLPVALITVGKALKDKEKSVWIDAILQLSKSNPRDIPNVLKEVYKPLKLSYDFLESEHSKSLFLLCSMFAEDFNIPLEELTWYVMGLRIFEETLNLEEVRNRMCTLVDMLKSRSLLQDGDYKDHVKMHDVVRDMAIFIASNEDLGFVIYPNNRSIDLPRKNSCKWISMISEETSELPMGLHFPNLQLLMVKRMELSDMVSLEKFFQGIKNLNVVSFRTMSMTSLPQSTKLLTNLQTLHLYHCYTLTNIAVVGDLASLEILCCRNCDQIQELPVDIGKLSRLRLLELHSCRNLRSIAPGVISKLTRLEGLKIRGSFSEWEGKEDEEGRLNASLTELERLRRLSWLEIEICDISLATMDICLSSNIVRYDITISPQIEPENCSLLRHRKKYMLLDFPREIILGNWIETFLRSVEALELKGDGSNRVNMVELQNVEFLWITECWTMNKLLDDSDWNSDIFPVLKLLNLHWLTNIEEICRGPIPQESNLFGNLSEFSVVNSFCNLSVIRINSCTKLRNVFPLSIARGLSQLEILEINSCPAMEEVFTNGENDGKGDLAFQKLKELKLKSLHSLRTFCKGVESIEFPQLTDMAIEMLSTLRSFAPAKTDLNLEGHHDITNCHVFCHEKFFTLKRLKLSCMESKNIWCPQIPTGFFKQLKELEIYEVKGISNLFSSSMALNLANLATLSIRYCREMVTVIADEEEVSKNSVLFPSLEYLHLGRLTMLRSFCQWKHAIELPSLKKVWIYYCNQMETFSLGSLITRDLEHIQINYIICTVTKDLNVAIQKYGNTT